MKSSHWTSLFVHFENLGNNLLDQVQHFTGTHALQPSFFFTNSSNTDLYHKPASSSQTAGIQTCITTQRLLHKQLEYRRTTTQRLLHKQLKYFFTNSWNTDLYHNPASSQTAGTQTCITTQLLLHKQLQYGLVPQPSFFFTNS